MPNIPSRQVNHLRKHGLYFVQNSTSFAKSKIRKLPQYLNLAAAQLELQKNVVPVVDILLAYIDEATVKHSFPMIAMSRDKRVYSASATFLSSRNGA